MDWIVKKANNLDVERQHLNKILADIKTTINELPSESGGGSSTADLYPIIGSVVAGGNNNGITVRYNTTSRKIDYRVNAFNITLNGAVTGSARVTDLGDVTITTSLEGTGFVLDAPADGQIYWRTAGQWQLVSSRIIGLGSVNGTGILSVDSNGNYYTSEIDTASSNRITVVNGDGLSGNPTLDLGTPGNTGIGEFLKVSVDSYGRIVGFQPVEYGDIIGELGYVPVNKAGDEMTGGLTVPSLYATGDIVADGLSYAKSFQGRFDGEGWIFQALDSGLNPRGGIYLNNSGLSLVNNTDSIWNELQLLNDGRVFANGAEVVTEAPQDGNIYGRKDGEWTVAGGSTGTGTFPFFLSNGTRDNISLTSSNKLPFFLANGTPSDIALEV